MGRARWRCMACGAEFAAWAAAERHADDTHHARIQALLGRYWPTDKTDDLLRPPGGRRDQE